MFQLDKKHQKYQKYNPTNIDWIGDIPDGWEVKKMKYIASIFNGSDHKDIESIDWEYPVFGSGGIFARANQSVYDWPSVLLWRKGTIDKPLFVNTPFWTVDTMFYSKIFKAYNPKLFYYLCLTIEFSKYQNGSALPSMTQSILLNIEFPISQDLWEQQKIADYLDNKTTLLDEAIAKKKKQIELLAEHRTALINNAITKWLDPNAPMKDSGIEWIGGIPKNWEIRRIKTFSQVRRWASPRPIDDPIYFDDNWEYSWVRIADVSASDRYLMEASQKLSPLWQSLSVQIEPWELFVSIAGTVGKPIISGIKCCIHDGFVYFNNLKYNKELLYWIFIAWEAYKWLWKLGTQLNLNTETIWNIAVPFPSIQEQQAIVEYIDKETKYIDDMIAKIEKSIELLEEYKTSLISHVVSGKIRVS